MSESNESGEAVIRSFIDAWGERDADKILGYFTDDAVYHNIPLEPARGKDEIRVMLDVFVPGSDEIAWEILQIASAGNVVFTERVDRFVMGGKNIALPVAGVFELRDGKIAAWRDYFDLQTWLTQSGS